MPTYIKGFDFGWKALNGALNDIAEANNDNAPLEGAGIRIEETESGCIISRADMVGSAGQPAQIPPNEIPNLFWITIYDIDEQEITIVDPATCAQSTITVVVRSPGHSVKFQAYIDIADFTIPGVQPGQPGGPPA